MAGHAVASAFMWSLDFMLVNSNVMSVSEYYKFNLEKFPLKM